MAQDLELKVDLSKYEARISMLQGKVDQLEALLEEYNGLKNRITEFMDANDDNIGLMQQNVEKRMDRVRKAIAATEENIRTLQDTLSNMNELGSNVSTLLEKGLEAAVSGIFS